MLRYARLLICAYKNMMPRFYEVLSRDRQWCLAWRMCWFCCVCGVFFPCFYSLPVCSLLSSSVERILAFIYLEIYVSCGCERLRRINERTTLNVWINRPHSLIHDVL